MAVESKDNSTEVSKVEESSLGKRSRDQSKTNIIDLLYFPEPRHPAVIRSFQNKRFVVVGFPMKYGDHICSALRQLGGVVTDVFDPQIDSIIFGPSYQIPYVVKVKIRNINPLVRKIHNEAFIGALITLRKALDLPLHYDPETRKTLSDYPTEGDARNRFTGGGPSFQNVSHHKNQRYPRKDHKRKREGGDHPQRSLHANENQKHESLKDQNSINNDQEMKDATSNITEESAVVVDPVAAKNDTALPEEELHEANMEIDGNKKNLKEEGVTDAQDIPVTSETSEQERKKPARKKQKVSDNARVKQKHNRRKSESVSSTKKLNVQKKKKRVRSLAK